MPPTGPQRRRGVVNAWSAMPALLAALLLAAGLGGAGHVDRAERAVAARLSWCGVAEPTRTVEGVRWQGQSTVGEQVVDVVVVPGGAEGVDASYVVAATPDPDGGWQVRAADPRTQEALGECLDEVGEVAAGG